MEKPQIHAGDEGAATRVRHQKQKEGLKRRRQGEVTFLQHVLKRLITSQRVEIQAAGKGLTWSLCNSGFAFTFFFFFWTVEGSATAAEYLEVAYKGTER